jgi:hypothetical protein
MWKVGECWQTRTTHDGIEFAMCNEPVSPGTQALQGSTKPSSMKWYPHRQHYGMGQDKIN